MNNLNFKNWILKEDENDVSFNIGSLVDKAILIRKHFQSLIQQNLDGEDPSVIMNLYQLLSTDNGFLSTILALQKSTKVDKGNFIINRNWLQRIKASTIHLKNLANNINNSDVKGVIVSNCNYIIQDINEALRS